MMFLIEFDGVLFDVQAAWFSLYRRLAAELGWWSLDAAAFWRQVRKAGREANVLPGAKPIKLKEYVRRFDEEAESDQSLSCYVPQPATAPGLPRLGRHGACVAVTLGRNTAARQAAVNRAGWSAMLAPIVALDADPRRRPGQLRVLAAGDPRAVVVAAGDALLRAAGQAELLAVGIASGACVAERLHAAGADVVYADLAGLVDSLDSGAADLIRSGLLPPSPGG
ncbi:MAG: HAD family hydrolase [Planctomycetes bacterium]|nr:HAD family hydrolase [Planctomycetota bacterium]